MPRGYHRFEGEPRFCRHCGAAFNPVQVTQLFCCQKCSDTHHNRAKMERAILAATEALRMALLKDYGHGPGVSGHGQDRLGGRAQ